MNLIFSVLAIFFLTTGSFAQNATSIQGTAIVPPSVGVPAPGYTGCPNCASQDGLTLSYSSSANGYIISDPHISGGQSALTVNLPLLGNAWTFLDTAPIYSTAAPLPPYCCFRGGLVGYPNSGYWNLDGTLTVAGPSGIEYDILVYVGGHQEPHTGVLQPDMITGGPSQNAYYMVGGGSGSCAGPSYQPCQIKFSAFLIFCGALGVAACEIRVAVYPKSAGPSIAALGWVGPLGGGPSAPPLAAGPIQANAGVPQGYVSYFYLRKERGLF